MRSAGNSLKKSSPSKKSHLTDRRDINRNDKQYELISDDKFLKYVQKLSESAKEMREIDKSLTLPDVQEVQKFNKYIEQAGVDLLKIQRIGEGDFKVTTRSGNHDQVKKSAFRKLGRLIKVDDLEEDGLTIVIENEWNTRFWTTEMIESACDALITLFSDTNLSLHYSKREKALAMLQTLMNRHKIANLYVQEYIETMTGKALDKTVRQGRCTGALDFLFVLHLFRERFTAELTKCNYTALAVELLLIEAKLAATIIQNTYRLKQSKKSYENIDVIGFWDPEELKKLRDGVSEGRFASLRVDWQNIRYRLKMSQRKRIGGERGTAHIPSSYLNILLEILLTLVSDTAGEYALTNRDIFLKLNGSVLLSTYISCPANQISDLSMAILANVSKIQKSYDSLLNVEIIKSCQKYFNYNYNSYKSSKKNSSNEQNKYLYKLNLVVTLLSNLASYASTMHRSAGLASLDKTMTIEKKTAAISDRSAILKVNKKLCNSRGLKELLEEIADFTYHTDQITTIKTILRCYLYLASSCCQPIMISILLMNASRLLRRVIELMEETDTDIHTIVLCLLLQCSSEYRNRESLLRFAPEFLRSFIVSSKKYNRLVYRKAGLISCALCRQDDWQYQDPDEMLVLYNNNQSVHMYIYYDILTTIKSYSGGLKVNLRTVPTWDDISDLLILPTNKAYCEKISKSISKQALRIGALGMCDYFSHPSDEQYYHSLSWVELTANCTIIETLSSEISTASEMYSYGTILFLVQAFNVCRQHFLGNPVPDHEATLILHAVTSISNSLKSFCTSSIGSLERIKDIIRCVTRTSGVTNSNNISDLMEAACFFLRTLTTTSRLNDETLSNQQLDLAISIIAFFDSYTSMIIATDEVRSESNILILTEWEEIALRQLKKLKSSESFIDKSLLHISEAGKTISGTMKSLKASHGNSERYDEILNQVCKFLTKLTVQYSSTSRAVFEWDVITALKNHLPPPNFTLDTSKSSTLPSIIMTTQKSFQITQDYSNIKISDANNDMLQFQYVTNLPMSMFELFSNLCQIEEGKSHCLSDGFLRRTLERFYILKTSLLDSLTPSSRREQSGNIEMTSPSRSTLRSRNQDIFSYRKKRIWSTKSVARADAVVLLKLINCMTNYHDPIYGNANDIIFSPLYNIVEQCIDILIKNLNQPESQLLRCREEELIVQVIRTLSILSKDVIPFAKRCEELDIVNVIINEINHASDYLFDSVVMYFELIKNIASGPRSPYLATSLSKLHIPMLKVIHIYPELESTIRDCNWIITEASRGSGYHFRATLTDPDKQLLNFFDSTMNTKSPQPEDIVNSNATTRQLSENDEIISSDNSQLKQRSIKGTYLDCAVSTCGSLRIHDQHTHASLNEKHHSNTEDVGHGKFSGTSDEEMNRMLTTLPLTSYDDQECELSRLSAREKSLQNLIESRKVAYGYKQPPPKSLKLTDKSPTKSNIRINKSKTLKSAGKHITCHHTIESEPRSYQTMLVVNVDDVPELAMTRPPLP